jgi:hypothetical protein
LIDGQLEQHERYVAAKRKRLAAQLEKMREEERKKKCVGRRGVVIGARPPT